MLTLLTMNPPPLCGSSTGRGGSYWHRPKATRLRPSPRHFPRSDGIHLDRRRLLHHVDLADDEILVAVTDTVQAEQLDDAS